MRELTSSSMWTFLDSVKLRYVNFPTGWRHWFDVDVGLSVRAVWCRLEHDLSFLVLIVKQKLSHASENCSDLFECQPLLMHLGRSCLQTESLSDFQCVPWSSLSDAAGWRLPHPYGIWCQCLDHFPRRHLLAKLWTSSRTTLEPEHSLAWHHLWLKRERIGCHHQERGPACTMVMNLGGQPNFSIINDRPNLLRVSTVFVR